MDSKMSFEASYVDAVCAKDELGVMPPLDRPTYDDDAEMWELWFEYFDPYEGSSDLVCLPFETIEEAQKVIRDIQTERFDNQKLLDEKKAKAKKEK
jgi:hypothetical protein